MEAQTSIWTQSQTICGTKIIWNWNNISPHINTRTCPKTRTNRCIDGVKHNEKACTTPCSTTLNQKQKSNCWTLCASIGTKKKLLKQICVLCKRSHDELELVFLWTMVFLWTVVFFVLCTNTNNHVMGRHAQRRTWKTIRDLFVPRSRNGDLVPTPMSRMVTFLFLHTLEKCKIQMHYYLFKTWNSFKIWIRISMFIHTHG